VREHATNSYHVPIQEQIKFFHTFWNSEQAWANQITLSIDNLSKQPNQYSYMKEYLSSVLNIVSKDTRSKDQRPELHITVHNLDALGEYQLPQIYSLVDVISVSSQHNKDFNADGLASIFPRKWIFNRNFMVPRDVGQWTQEDFDYQLTYKNYLYCYDHVYFLINKLPLGTPKPIDIEKQKAYLAGAMRLYTLLKQDLGDKISLDSCVSDSQQYHSSGFGCSANISKFQVWPDGTVSGCPYAFSGYGEIAKSAEDILENIRIARRQYDFSRCYIPQTCRK
jgi:hypothetical protein